MWSVVASYKEAHAMQNVTFLTDLFEMIAALAALGVTYLMYREVRRNRDKDEK